MTTPSTVDATVEAQARAAWRRITAAVESGAPVPYSINMHGGGAAISYNAPQNPDPLADAAAMARALGLTDGPKSGSKTVRWENSPAEWDATGESWQVWAHLPAEAPADLNDGIGGAS